MPYWNFEYTKAVIYTAGKCGRWYRPRSCNCNEVTHFGLNQPPVFSSATTH